MKTATWIQTYTGRRFDPFNPVAEAVSLRDIAHALGNLCRFNGHCRRFYSVAEHSVRASHIVPPEHALYALLHDASEAYIADIVRPVKQAITGYAEIERQVMAAVCRKFGLLTAFPESVELADRVMLSTERRDLLLPDSSEWPVLFGITPLEDVIEPWSPAMAKERFLERYAEIVCPEEAA